MLSIRMNPTYGKGRASRSLCHQARPAYPSQAQLQTSRCSNVISLDAVPPSGRP